LVPSDFIRRTNPWLQTVSAFFTDITPPEGRAQLLHKKP
jgi:hypothetical protein